METTRLLTYIPKKITGMSSVVYFLQGSSGLIKIGLSKRLNRRMLDIMTTNDGGMVLVGVMLGYSDLELSIHKMFEKYRRHGEWFYPADELVRYVKQNRDPSVQKIIETIRDIGPGRKEAVAQIVDLDLPAGEEDWLPLPVMIPEGHPGDNYDYRMKGFFDPDA